MTRASRAWRAGARFDAARTRVGAFARVRRCALPAFSVSALTQDRGASIAGPRSSWSTPMPRCAAVRATRRRAAPAGRAAAQTRTTPSTHETPSSAQIETAVISVGRSGRRSGSVDGAELDARHLGRGEDLEPVLHAAGVARGDRPPRALAARPASRPGRRCTDEGRVPQRTPRRGRRCSAQGRRSSRFRRGRRTVRRPAARIHAAPRPRWWGTETDPRGGARDSRAHTPTRRARAHRSATSRTSCARQRTRTRRERRTRQSLARRARRARSAGFEKPSIGPIGPDPYTHGRT